MSSPNNKINSWADDHIKMDQVTRYMKDGKDFIDDAEIEELILDGDEPSLEQINQILDKSLTIEMLSPAELSTLMKVKNPEHWQLMKDTALAVKKKVYNNRIVTFAPLYMSNFCVNNCSYCGFRTGNCSTKRRKLTLAEIRQETEVLAGKIGHKRLVVVYGTHPTSDIDYMVDSIKTIYATTAKTEHGENKIRRINVNATPMSIEKLEKLVDVGIGTYQVFQETYHKKTYSEVHPENTVKGNYDWRLYTMHRAFDAGIDDVGLGALFGIYNWKFEVMGLLMHSLELEQRFGVGPHTISFPRLEPANDTPYVTKPKWEVDDETLKKIVVLLRLAVPHAGMILTAREDKQLRREIIPLGITQTDASTKIGIGAYSENDDELKQREQFEIGDARSLDEVICELAKAGYITSFCTAGYRCGRTGECIMDMLKTGQEGVFCKLNAILTFREWLDDFASEETKIAGEKVIQNEIDQVQKDLPEVHKPLMDYYKKVLNGERDIYF